MARIHAEVVKALADPQVKEQFDTQGLEGVGMPPAEFARFVQTESQFINELARKIKATKSKWNATSRPGSTRRSAGARS